MKLCTLLLERKLSSLFHLTISFWGLPPLARGRLRSVVSDFNSTIGRRRLSTATDLRAALSDWNFGPYIAELEAEITREPLHTEYILYEGDRFRLARWAINFAYWHRSDTDIEWFDVGDLEDFPRRSGEFDERVLQHCRDGSYDIGVVWANDFKGGRWPEFERLVHPGLPGLATIDNLRRPHDELPPHRRKFWGPNYRASLYGTSLPDWAEE